MYEVGQQFRESADVMIASEGTVPNAGWSYPEMLECFTNDSADTRRIAKACVKRYIEKQANFSIGGVSVDIAAWDLTLLESLNHKFSSFTKALIECFSEKMDSVYTQMRRVLFQTHYTSQTYLYEQNVDLGDFCNLLNDELDLVKRENGGNLDPKIAKLQDSCKLVVEEIDRCIILGGHSGGSFQHSTGIALFFPWSLTAYSVSRKDYEELDFVAKTEAGMHWNQFLQKYLGEVTLRKGLSQDIKEKGIGLQKAKHHS
ncbi:MAG: hypothetical protein HKN25_11250, partial [Pyrinomonadaceae bacterium]|nr:hypothetical protein [Pyrinomonadaceae bacterium]